MRATVFATILLCQCLFAQGITVSKDSILVYNSMALSFVDRTMFVNHGLGPVGLDSAIVTIEEMDTGGLGPLAGGPGLQLLWQEGSSSGPQVLWSMDSSGPNRYRLSSASLPPTPAPLSFANSGDSCLLSWLQIGSCFFCGSFPRYPRYVKGVLTLFFSNAQVIPIRLRSPDLRVALRSPVRYPYSCMVPARQTQFLADGRRFPTEINGRTLSTGGIHVVVR